MLELLMKMRPLSSPTSTSLVFAGDDRLHRRVEVERDADVLGEVVERAERQHAERSLRADECRGDGADRSVAAGGDDGAAAFLGIAAGDWCQVAAVPDDDGLGLGAVLAEQRGDALGQLRGPVGARAAVDDACYDGLGCQLVHADHPPHLWERNTDGPPLVPIRG